MEMLAMIVVAGTVGGVVVALLLMVAHRLWSGRTQFDVFEQDGGARRTDVINIASVRVAGVGGLGLVIVAATLAWSMPRIGQTIGLGAILGVAMATVLILRRRRLGPMPTSSAHPGANTTLSIDEPSEARR